MSNEVFKPREVVIVKSVWTFTEDQLIRDVDSSVGFTLPDEVEDAFYEYGYKIRVNRVKGKMEVYAYRHSTSEEAETIYLSNGESVELLGYGDIRTIKL